MIQTICEISHAGDYNKFCGISMPEFIPPSEREPLSPSPSSSPQQFIKISAVHDHDYDYDDRYNTNSNHGRNLMTFLNTLDLEEVERRKTSRIDAAEAARNVKFTYKFEAVDVTRINWSSDNLSKSLSSLSHLHREHGSKLKVQSFYPLHLVLTSDDHQERLCVYGGTLLLNAAATPLQWLRVMMSVNEEHLVEVKQKREELYAFTRQIQEVLPVKLRKGATCSAMDYYYCLKGIAEVTEAMMMVNDCDNNGELLSDGDSALTMTSTSLTHASTVTISVEAFGSYRRAVVTKDGIIRVGADITAESVIATCQRLSEEAASKREKAEERDLKCRDLMKRVKDTFELLYLRRQPRSTVTSDQILNSLGRLLEMRQNLREHEIIKSQLYRNSLRIAASGQLCQLGSDGSIVLPWDWQ